MKNNKTYRIYLLTVLVLFFILVFILFINTRNLSVLFIENIKVFNLHYFYIFVLLILGIAFYLLSNRLSKVLWLTLKDNEKLVEELALQTVLEQENIETKNNKEDFTKIVSRIVPDEKETESKEVFAEKLLINISKEYEIVVGIVYLKNKKEDLFSYLATYAYFSDKNPEDFKTGITLAGQAAKDKTILNLSELPDNYITVLSGLGKSKPNNLLIIPIVYNDITIGIIELASFKKFDDSDIELYTELAKRLGKIFNHFLK
ncbi:MAG: GAF domain-containing protein [Bacteroidales bacterium]|nr:GAF domain-containing protein [Bacteroidales bacterium]